MSTQQPSTRTRFARRPPKGVPQTKRPPLTALALCRLSRASAGSFRFEVEVMRGNDVIYRRSGVHAVGGSCSNATLEKQAFKDWLTSTIHDAVPGPLKFRWKGQRDNAMTDEVSSYQHQLPLVVEAHRRCAAAS